LVKKSATIHDIEFSWGLFFVGAPSMYRRRVDVCLLQAAASE